MRFTLACVLVTALAGTAIGQSNQEIAAALLGESQPSQTTVPLVYDDPHPLPQLPFRQFTFVPTADIQQWSLTHGGDGVAGGIQEPGGIIALYVGIPEPPTLLLALSRSRLLPPRGCGNKSRDQQDSESPGGQPAAIPAPQN